jgi:hypothetical protein
MRCSANRLGRSAPPQENATQIERLSALDFAMMGASVGRFGPQRLIRIYPQVHSGR